MTAAVDQMLPSAAKVHLALPATPPEEGGSIP